MPVIVRDITVSTETFILLDGKFRPSEIEIIDQVEKKSIGLYVITLKTVTIWRA